MSNVQFPNREGKNNSNYRHGMSSHPLRSIYTAMIRRCTNKKDQRYSDYGGRGITICNEWLIDRKSFFKWALDSGWKQGITLDRRDNNEGYNPDNCRLVDVIIQNRNKRNTIMITYNGITKSLPDWCDDLNISYWTAYSRLYREKLTPDIAFTRPLLRRRTN